MLSRSKVVSSCSFTCVQRSHDYRNTRRAQVDKVQMIATSMYQWWYLPVILLLFICKCSSTANSDHLIGKTTFLLTQQTPPFFPLLLSFICCLSKVDKVNCNLYQWLIVCYCGCSPLSLPTTYQNQFRVSLSRTLFSFSLSFTRFSRKLLGKQFFCTQVSCYTIKRTRMNTVARKRGSVRDEEKERDGKTSWRETRGLVSEREGEEKEERNSVKSAHLTGKWLKKTHKNLLFTRLQAVWMSE